MKRSSTVVVSGVFVVYFSDFTAGNDDMPFCGFDVTKMCSSLFQIRSLQYFKLRCFLLLITYLPYFVKQTSVASVENNAQLK